MSSNNFYKKLGASGLAQLTNEKRTAGYVRFLKKNLPNNDLLHQADIQRFTIATKIIGGRKRLLLTVLII